MHSALSNKFAVVVPVVAAVPFVTAFKYAAIDGKRVDAVVTTLGRAVNAIAAGITQNTAINPTVFFSKFIRLTPY